MFTPDRLDRSAAHAAKLARETYDARLPYASAGCDPAAGAASAAVSVAVGHACNPITEGETYGAMLSFVGDLYRHDRPDEGRTQALFQVRHMTRTVDGAERLADFALTIAEILERSQVDLTDGGRTVRELRSYAATLTAFAEGILAANIARTDRVTDAFAARLADALSPPPYRPVENEQILGTDMRSELPCQGQYVRLDNHSDSTVSIIRLRNGSLRHVRTASIKPAAQVDGHAPR